MAKCIRCGDSAWPNKRVCPACMKKWVASQHSAYDLAVSELGPLSAENHKAFVERVKQIKRERKLEASPSRQKIEKE